MNNNKREREREREREKRAEKVAMLVDTKSIGHFWSPESYHLLEFCLMLVRKPSRIITTEKADDI